jgi:phosphoglycolate phosphatase-like HAD superfamily hydrolase
VIKDLIFDFDGVIVESTAVKTEAFAKLFEAEGTDIVNRIVSYHKDNMGVSRFDKFRHIYRNILHKNLGNDEFNSLCARFASLVVDAVIAVPFVKGAQEFLRENSNLYTFFVVSATPQNEISNIILRRSLDKTFKYVFGAPLAKREAVKIIMQKEKKEPFEVVYIGDAMSDYLAARDNNIRFIARIEDNEDIFRDINCLKIRDFLQLPKILKSL